MTFIIDFGKWLPSMWMEEAIPPILNLWISEKHALSPCEPILLPVSTSSSWRLEFTHTIVHQSLDNVVPYVYGYYLTYTEVSRVESHLPFPMQDTKRL